MQTIRKKIELQYQIVSKQQWIAGHMGLQSQVDHLNQKKLWFPIEWKWKKGIARATPARYINTAIYLCNPNVESTTISKLDFNQNKEVLGIFQAPSSNIAAQIEKLENIRDKYIPVLTNNYIPQELVCISFWGKL